MTPNTAQIDDPDSIDTATTHGWTELQAETEKTIRDWWKAGATHVQARYTSVSVIQTREVVTTRVSQYNEFGLVESSTVIYSCRRDRSDAYKRAIEKATEYRSDHPGEGTLDNRPSLPSQIGAWKLKNSGLSPIKWVTDAGHRLEIHSTGVTGGQSPTQKYALSFLHPEIGERTVYPEGIRVRCLRAAKRCMDANPDADITDSVSSPLTAVEGISRIRAVKCQLAGYHTPEELADALTGEKPHNVSHQLEYILPEPVRDRLKDTNSSD